MTTYALICNTFGRKFSFEAKDAVEALSLAKGWARYQGHSPKDYMVIETTETHDLHQEYVS